MKMEYRFIEFVEAKDTFSPKPYYACKNKNHKDILGHVEYYPEWKRYTFNPEPMTVYSIDCLEDIIHFIKQL